MRTASGGSAFSCLSVPRVCPLLSIHTATLCAKNAPCSWSNGVHAASSPLLCFPHWERVIFQKRSIDRLLHFLNSRSGFPSPSRQVRPLSSAKTFLWRVCCLFSLLLTCLLPTCSLSAALTTVRGSYLHSKDELHTLRGSLKYTRSWVNYNKYILQTHCWAPKVKKKKWVKTWRVNGHLDVINNGTSISFSDVFSFGNKLLGKMNSWIVFLIGCCYITGVS